MLLSDIFRGSLRDNWSKRFGDILIGIELNFENMHLVEKKNYLKRKSVKT